MKQNPFYRWSAIPLALGWLSTISNGSSGDLVSEPLGNYSPGSLSSQTGGGTGWTGNWIAPGAVVRADVMVTTSSPMTFAPTGGHVVNGASRALEVQLSGPPASQLCGVRTLANPIAQTFYVSYLVRYNAGAGWLATSVKSS